MIEFGNQNGLLVLLPSCVGVSSTTDEFFAAVRHQRWCDNELVVVGSKLTAAAAAAAQGCTARYTISSSSRATAAVIVVGDETGESLLAMGIMRAAARNCKLSYQSVMESTPIGRSVLGCIDTDNCD